MPECMTRGNWSALDCTFQLGSEGLHVVLNGSVENNSCVLRTKGGPRLALRNTVGIKDSYKRLLDSASEELATTRYF